MLQQQMQELLAVCLPLPSPVPLPKLRLQLLHMCPLRNSWQECSQEVPAHWHPLLLLGMNLRSINTLCDGHKLAKLGVNLL